MGGFPPQPGYPAQQGLPPQPGYPAAAPGSAAPSMTPGYPGGQGMPAYGQQPMQQAMGGAYQQQPMDPYQQQVMQGYQQPAMQPGMPGGYQQQAMQGYQQPVAGSTLWVSRASAERGRRISWSNLSAVGSRTS